MARMVKLAPDLQVLAYSPLEVRYIYNEIFEDDCYLGPLDPLPETPTVLDVGANVGLFALRVLKDYPQAKVFCFEPVPDTYQALCQNLRGHTAQTLPLGLAEYDGTATMSYYPMLPGNSSLHARELTPELLDKMFVGFRTLEKRWWTKLVGRRVFSFLAKRVWGRPRQVEAKVSRLSSFLVHHGTPDIDLLKIDVERAEWDVLQGIDDHHWPRLKQLAIEVTSLDTGRGHLEQIVDLLKGRCYQVEVLESAINREARLAIENELGVEGRVDHLVIAKQC